MITQIPSKILDLRIPIKILGNNELVEEHAGFPVMSWDTPCVYRVRWPQRNIPNPPAQS